MSAIRPLVYIDGTMYVLPAGDVINGDVQNLNITAPLINNDAVTITKGMPLYVYSAGNVRRAVSSALASSKVCGLCYDDSVVSGGNVIVQVSGQIELAVWTSITGTAALTPNAYYFLDSTSGRLTESPPTSGFITLVGIALTTTKLDIKINDPIQL